MAPDTDEQSSFLTSSGRHDPRLAPLRASSRFLSRAYTFIPAVVIGLHALPATAAGLDPAKVTADPFMQRTLEAIDGAHHLSSVGPLAQYVIALHKKRNQACTLADKEHDIFLLDCAASDKYPAHTLLLNGENGRLLVVAMYDKANRPLDSATLFAQLTAISSPESDLVAGLGDPAPPSASMRPDPPPRQAGDPDAFRPSLPHSVDLVSGTNAATRFWASDVSYRKQDLLGTAELLSAVERKGGRCVIGPALGGSGSPTGADGSASEIVCRYPRAGNLRPDAADELVLEASLSRRDCMRGGHDCYEIRDITLNNERLTSAQYLQLVQAPATPMRVAPPDLPGGMPIAEGTTATTIFRAVGHKILLGRPWDLDAFARQGGGVCAMAETKGGEAETVCRFPDPQTSQVHELDLQASYSILGMPLNTAAYDVSSITLDGRPLPYADYRRTFVDRK